jgi:hypothetical protein
VALDADSMIVAERVAVVPAASEGNMMAILPKTLSYKKLSFEFRKRFIGFDVPSKPHFSPDAVTFFQERIEAAKFYLEFGSGGSTVLAAQMGKRGFSVESDRFYLRDVRKKIKGSTHGMKLTWADVGPTGAWGRPDRRKPTEQNVLKWRNYVEAPFREIGNEFYDLILVDGRWRVAAALNSLREGAARNASFTLLFDDYRRKHYHAIEAFAGSPKMVDRMAVFEIDQGRMPKVPTEDDLSRFIRDIR